MLIKCARTPNYYTTSEGFYFGFRGFERNLLFSVLFSAVFRFLIGSYALQSFQLVWVFIFDNFWLRTRWQHIQDEVTQWRKRTHRWGAQNLHIQKNSSFTFFFFCFPFRIIIVNKTIPAQILLVPWVTKKIQAQVFTRGEWK